MTNRIINPAPPSLPLGTDQYDRRYQDQYSNILRLYFNQLKNSLGLLWGDRGGQYLQFPYAAIQRNTDKTFTANTPTQITFEQNDFLSGCSNDGTDGIHVSQTGIYNYQFSIQFANTDTQIHSAWVWLRINGVDVAGTGSRWDITAKHGASDGYVLAAANFYVQLNAGDTIEMWAAVANAGVYMEAYPASTSPFARPSIPSVVATLSFVSALSA
jgi:hypothetical protein